MAVLATKLFRPLPRSDAVVRSRLLDQLREGMARRVTLISAPAGFGKTTLLAQWLSQIESRALSIETAEQDASLSSFPTLHAPFKTAWLSLDEGEGEPGRFLTYLVAALRTAGPHLGDGVVVALQSSPQPPAEAILTTLLNEIATLPGRIMLVLDDYHLVDSAPVDRALAFLIEHIPAQLHLVIATREDPQLPLARYRARGQLTELRAAELRFTPAEAAGLLNGAMGLALPAGDVTTLDARTEGWAAGLQLAALSLRGRHDPTAFIRSFAGSNRFVMDYLVEEVLRQQTPEREAFLLRTAILSRLCGPLCDAVLGAPAGSAQVMLEALEQGNLFLFPLDHERRWYRYHQLFAEVLQQRLQQVEPAPAVYHLRASAWYESQGMELEALRHATAAGDLELVARIAERSWEAMDASFQTAAWLGWVQRLPDALIQARPVLGVQCAWALIDAGELEAAELRLQAAERVLTAPVSGSAGLNVVEEAQLRTLPARIATARAYSAQARGDVVTTAAQAELALSLLPDTEPNLRAQAMVLLGFTCWAQGDLESAYWAIADWSACMEQSGNVGFVLAGAFGLAELRTAQGRLRDAVAIYEQALQRAVEQDRGVQLVTPHLHLGLAMLYHELGRHERVAPLLATGQELGAQTPIVDWPFRWRRALAQLKEDEGAFDTAIALLDEASRLYVRNPVPEARPIEALKARVYLRQGRLDLVRAWVVASGVAPDDEPGYLDEFAYLVLVRLRLAEYQRDRDERALRDARGLLARLERAAAAGGRVASIIEILVLQALAHEAGGAMSAGLVALERALILAEPEGYVQLFVREGPPLARLLSLVGAHAAPSGYAGRLLAALGQPASPGPQGLAEPLSGRELEVLRLVAQGLSNQQIADRLSLALSSVKGHNLRIFAKLQVQRRTEAIARARELGLL